MKLGDIVKDYRNSHKLSMEKFALLANVSKGYISMLEKGENPKTKKPISPSFDTIKRIALAMNRDFEDLVADLDDGQKISLISQSSTTTPQSPTDELTARITDKVVQLTTPRKKIVLGVATEQLEAQEKEVKKVLSLPTASETDIEEELTEYHVYERLSAGKGSNYYNDYNYDTVYYDEDISHDLASWIFGDSMEPAYLNGEVALIKDTGFDYDGAVYAVDWAGQTYIKKVYKEKDGLRLVSLNPKYAPLFAHMDEDPRIIGKVIGHFMPVEG